MGDNLAQKLGLAVGDKVRLMITENSQYTPFGRVPVQRLFTVSELYYDYGEASGYEVFANLGRYWSPNAYSTRVRLKAIVYFWMILSKSQNCRVILKRVISAIGVSKKGSFSKRFVWKKNMMGLLISLIIVVAISNIVTSLSLMVVDKQGRNRYFANTRCY